MHCCGSHNLAAYTGSALTVMLSFDCPSSPTVRSSERACSTNSGVLLSSPAGACKGSKGILCWRSKSSYFRRRSKSSRSGNLRRRGRGARVGTHCAPARMQLAQGNLRSHLTLRCWHSTHASTRGDFAADREEVGVEALCSGGGISLMGLLFGPWRA